MLQLFFLDPRQGGGKGEAYKCEKRLKRKKKKETNKGTFLFNPKGYFLAFSSLGKVVWDFRSGESWRRGSGVVWGHTESPLELSYPILPGLTEYSAPLEVRALAGSA